MSLGHPGPSIHLWSRGSESEPTMAEAGASGRSRQVDVRRSVADVKTSEAIHF